MGKTLEQEVFQIPEHFPTLDLRVSLVPLAPLHLPRFPGVTLRGAFGWALRRTVCVTRLPVCSRCHLYGSCAYAYIFETPIAKTLKGAPAVPYAPHPFVLEPPPPGTLQIGEPFSFGLRLLGRAVNLFPHVIQAFETLARGGLGSQRVRLKLLEVNNGHRVLYAQRQYLAPPAPRTLGDWVRTRLRDLQPLPSVLKLNFLSPVRIVHRGALQRIPTFEAIVAALHRRLSLLNQVHGDGTPLAVPPNLATLAGQVQARVVALKPVEVRRYSRRQQRRHELHGFQGVLELEGPLEPFLPLLLAGERVYLGKSTSFGMGRYQVGR